MDTSPEGLVPMVKVWGRRLSVQDTLGSAHAEMQLEGHSSMQAPQLEHLEVSMMATPRR